MIKNKGKIFITIMLVLLFGALFATMAFALEGDSITIAFYNSGNTIDKSYGDEGYVSLIGGQSYKLPTKEVGEGQSFNWRTADGQAWEGGTEVTFYEDTSLFPITAVDVYTFEELNYWVSDSGSKGKGGCKVRLMEDIEITKNLGFAGGEMGYESYFILNGKKITISSSLDKGWGGSRHGSHFYGTGTIEYLGNGRFIDLNNHGWGGAHCKLFIGKGVTINAPSAVLARDGDGSITQGFPEITIYGTAVCKNVLKLDNGNNRNPHIIVHNSGKLTINDSIVWNNAPGNTTHVIVDGGTIYCNSASISFFNDSSTSYEITGGLFKFSYSGDKDNLLKNIDLAKYRIIELTDKNGTTYQTVVDMVCTHDYQYKATLSASCSNGTLDVFRCSKCQNDIYATYGTMIDHDLPSEYIYKPATKTENGWKKYICKCCFCAVYEYVYYDPTNDAVTVIIDTGSGKTEVQAIVKDVFAITSGCVTGVKEFTDTEGTKYTLNQIVGLYIPVGISSVKITAANTYVKEVILGKNLGASIDSLTGLSSLETITIEDVTSVIFGSNCAPASLKSIISKEVEGGTRSEIEFANNAFNGRANLTEVTFISNADYIFGDRSFYQVGVKEVIFPDYCTLNFKGPKAFSEAKTEYVYFGKGITEIKNYPFDDGWYLQKIVLMDVTQLNDWAFSRMNKGPNVPVVYHHADTLSLKENTFNSGHGIIVYTKAPITTGFKDCKAVTKNGVDYPAYTIHYGISHPYERIETASTCLKEGSVKFETTCPCGVNDGASYKIFYGVVTNSSNYTIEDCTDKIKEILPHDTKDVSEISYSNGYTKYGYGIYLCSMCGNGIKEKEPTCTPLVKCLGYSVPNEDGTKSITVKYVINKDMLDAYEKANGIKLEYGVVIVAKSSLSNGETPLDENGNARNGAIKYQISDFGYTSSQIKISNISESQKSDSFVMCTYIKDGNNISYIQDNETVENPSGVSYKEIKELADYMASMSMTTVSSDDE